MSHSPPLKRAKSFASSGDNDVEMTDADAPSTSNLPTGNSNFMSRFATYAVTGTTSLNNNMVSINGHPASLVANNGNFEEIPNDPSHESKK